MAKQIEIKVPDIGDFDAVEIIEVLVSSGDEVSEEQALITLESDKATMEVPTEVAGKLIELKVKEGDKVAEGDVIAIVEAAGEAEAKESATEESATDSTSEAEPADKSDEADENAGDAAEGNTEQAASKQASNTESAASEAVVVPDIGDFDAVEVIEVLVKAGDQVAAEQALITLESDKATMEVPAPKAGVISSISITEGDKVSAGDVIAELRSGEAGSSSASATESKSAASKQASEPEKAAGNAGKQSAEQSSSTAARTESSAENQPSSTAKIDDAAFKKAHASPSVRRFARELGVNLAQVAGTGRKGRITKTDVQQFVKGALSATPATAPAVGAGGGIPAIPPVDFSKFGEIEEVKLPRIRKISAAHLHRCWLNVPHVTQFDEADITEMEAFRQAEKDQHEVKLTPLAFLIKACAMGLKQFPDFNSAMAPDGEHLIRRQYINIGFAADTPTGLVVPVVKDAGSKSLLELAKEAGELAAKAREGKLKPADMSGGCFSISSLGGIGGTAFTPIVNAPEVAILGVSKSATKPVWDGQAFQPRLMLPLSLSYDHRVIDGAAAARFTTYLGQQLGDIRRLLL